MKPTMPPVESRQLRALLEAMLRGETLTMLTGMHKYNTTATTQRCNELERDYGWPIRRGWLKLPSSKRVRTYAL